MGARAYDPSTGLVLQRDPVAYVDALNLYAGFGWDPVNNRDPTGEAAEQMQRQDDLALLQGRMSKEEYRARQNARGMGAATGAVAAGGVALAAQAPAIAGSVQAFGLRHPIGLSQAGCFLASLFDEGNAIECGWADDAGRRTGRLGRNAAQQFENWGEGGAEAVETAIRRVEQSFPAAGRAATTVRGGVTAASQAGRQVGRFRLTETVARHADDIVKRGAHAGQPARPYLNSPQTIEQIIQTGRGVPDPGGVVGTLRYDVAGTFRGSQGTWELVVSKGNEILHFNFVR